LDFPLHLQNSPKHLRVHSSCHVLQGSWCFVCSEPQQMWVSGSFDIEI
jgi:hypothetical protein